MASDLKVDNLKKADGTALITAGVVQSGVTFPAGHVLQVVSSTKTTTQSLTPTGALNWQDISDLSVGIVPKTGNKVLVLVSVNTGGKQDYNVIYRLVRGSTGIFVGTGSMGSKSASSFHTRSRGDEGPMVNIAGQFLDASPGGDGSATITYKVQTSGESTQTILINSSHTEADNYSFGRTASSITVMEVQA